MGDMIDGGPPGPYQGYLNNKCVTIAEVLKTAGYTTLMSGKWHVGERRPKWPVDRLLDHYYGIISGGMNYFDINRPKQKGIKRHFAIDGEPHTPPNKGFYVTDAFTENAMQFLNEYGAEDEPFFLYLAYTAPHWPLHAPQQTIEKYRGRFVEGWDKLRQKRYQRQIKMGIINKSWDISARDDEVTAWEDVPNKEEMELKMAVYAAQLDHVDRGVGQVIDKLRQLGKLDNTLILFLSDNGGCHEGGPWGGDWWDNDVPPGSVDSFKSYGRSWANLSNTPFRMFKHWVHEGGISTPLIAHWPAVIKSKGTLTGAVGHVTDIMATCADIAGADYPREYKGNSITPLQGKSLMPLFQGKTRKGREALYWEHEGNCAVRKGKWKLVSKQSGEWELYDLEADRTETTNLADAHPEIVSDLKSMYSKTAADWGVEPWPRKRN
jgi:arylsulfatase